MSKDTVDSSDDEEEYVIEKIKAGYFPYVVNNLIDIRSVSTTTLAEEPPDVEFDYRLGMALQHIADRFFRHTELGRRYKELKTELLAIEKARYDQFITQVRLFFTSQDSLIRVEEPIESVCLIQLFNHLFSDKVPLPHNVYPKTADSSYREQLVIEISKHEGLLRIINEIFPVNILSLVQSDTSTNAVEVLAFSKLINRYIKNELKAILCNSSIHSCEVDKFIHLKFQQQTIRDLNESWVLRPQTRKAQSKINSLGDYTEIFDNLTQDNKVGIINRIFDLLHNRATDTSLEIKDAQYADKLVELLFVSELARNKAAIFTTLMFLDLLNTQDISNNSVKERLIKLFPMAAKGAMQSSRDLVNEPKLENTHYMDFNHDGNAHVNILRAQGELWRSYCNELETIRKLIILLDKKSCADLKPNTFMEYVIATEKFLPQGLVRDTQTLQQLYQQVVHIDDLSQRKQCLMDNFTDSLSQQLIESATHRTLGKVVEKLFSERIEQELRSKYTDSLELHEKHAGGINLILEEAITKLYQRANIAYNFPGFDTDKFELTANIPSKKSDDGDSIDFSEVLSDGLLGNETENIAGGKRDRESDEVTPPDSKKARVEVESPTVHDNSDASVHSGLIGDRGNMELYD